MGWFIKDGDRVNGEELPEAVTLLDAPQSITVPCPECGNKTQANEDCSECGFHIRLVAVATSEHYYDHEGEAAE